MAKYLDKIGLSYFWSLIKSKLIPAGGQQGQVLAKASSADDDVAWVSTGVNNLIGDNLVAASNRQIVIGQYNEADNDENAIIVGNGTDETDQQNVFLVRRVGEVFVIDKDWPTSTPEEGYNHRFMHFANGDGTETDGVLGYIQGGYSTDGRTHMEYGARRVVNDAGIFNYVRFGIQENGTRSIDLADAAAWRTALNIGHKWTNSSTMSISTVNSDISGPSITVPSGVYIVYVSYTFPIGASSGNRETTVGIKYGNNTGYNKVIQATNAPVRTNYVDIISTSLSALTITSYIRSSMKCGNGGVYIAATRIG